MYLDTDSKTILGRYLINLKTFLHKYFILRHNILSNDIYLKFTYIYMAYLFNVPT